MSIYFLIVNFHKPVYYLGMSKKLSWGTKYGFNKRMKAWKQMSHGAKMYAISREAAEFKRSQVPQKRWVSRLDQLQAEHLPTGPLDGRGC